MPTKKHLGQHWLKDPEVLAHIADAVDILSDDTVLEVGPGLGTLTSRLLARAGSVVAVEFDADLAKKLPGQFPGKNLQVIHEDILQFNPSALPAGYKVVANVPYYITSKIIQHLTESQNPPSAMVLLVQKEVAERLAAGPGDYSILAVAAQVYHEVSLGNIVPAELFTPPPKVDSRVVILKRRIEPLVPEERQSDFFRLVRAGFSAKRKKLRSSLAGGLQLSKTEVENLLQQANISPDARAEALTIDQWLTLLQKYDKMKG
ncbi:MAG TPA: 16S rRNA (adenine(1518)-N(6)/adenine(1519)-N(6))-dimethyltransferase RsmA [Candidatus Saccharibacteria bacterium]|nr:16S rRNA (adenine(1518)-N(6)/adenine(1519)-N(6))-dimethyltransferase RsmA [Candidatus Saccharibacteria bacterium]HMR38285.1 16S rRNA (adenine(1518)-N(6)/adenine(1519)-N(6))-dimethyltransferase RsmA [Candidatus Saccharibacteria bacterium]